MKAKSRAGRRGQAMTEFALATPLLTALLLGSIEVGRYARCSIIVHAAAEAGARYGAGSLIVAKDTTNMKALATADASNLTGVSAGASQFCKCADGSTSTCLPTDCTSSHRLTYVTVTTTATFHPLFHYPGLSNAITINGASTMRVGD